MKRVNASDFHGADRAIAGDSDAGELPSDYRILATLDLGIGCGAAESDKRTRHRRVACGIAAAVERLSWG